MEWPGDLLTPPNDPEWHICISLDGRCWNEVVHSHFGNTGQLIPSVTGLFIFNNTDILVAVVGFILLEQRSDLLNLKVMKNLKHIFQIINKTTSLVFFFFKALE